MNIVGGSFGVSGSARITKEGNLEVRGVKAMRFAGSEISSVTARTEKERKFGYLGFVLGAIILSVILGAFLNVLGIVLAFVLSAAGSFYSNRKTIADVAFSTGDMVSLECTSGQVARLIKLKN